MSLIQRAAAAGGCEAPVATFLGFTPRALERRFSELGLCLVWSGSGKLATGLWRA